jgi:hypothetical protein
LYAHILLVAPDRRFPRRPRALRRVEKSVYSFPLQRER